MRTYRYQAVTAGGQEVLGELAHESPEDLQLALAEQGLTLLDVREKRIRSFSFGRGKARDEELIEATRSMASLLTAGVPLLQVLDDLADGADRGPWRNALVDVRLRVEGGSSLSDAFEAHGHIFDRVYVSLVRAGEESGSLDVILARLATYLEWNRSVRKDLRRAMAYPLAIMGAMVGFVAIISIFVFPRLADLIDSLAVEVPPALQLMLAGSALVRSIWPILLAAPVVGFTLIKLWGRTPRGRRVLDRALLRAPLVGPLQVMGSLSRFTNTMSTLLGAGIALDRSLRLSRHAVGNEILALAVDDAEQRIQVGETFSEALGHAGGFPRQMIRIVRVGETRGDLPGMLERLTEHYDRELPYVVRRIVSSIGPIAVVVLAITVGSAAVGTFTLLLRINDAIG
jgi:type IV pilus assembly protein PilC